ncbi:MAG: TetR/AcrR family transcriptional regulator [Deltaproteobacteria bacterium]|nr:TetR/AcrR family transcriptional regulator [Deltaproteobacteria bacterium]
MDTSDTVDAIVLAASAELRDSGIGAFRIRQVAQRAGVSPGTVTHYFPTSRELLEAVIEAFQRQAWSLWLDQPRATGRVDAEVLIERLYRLCCEHREIVRARLFLTAQDGRISGPNWRGSLGPFLEALGSRTSIDKRLIGHTVVFLAMRYAIHPEEELLALCGVDDVATAHKAVVAHLRAIALTTDWSQPG